MNKVLFPSQNPIDFAAAGGQIGWAPIVAPNSLKTMADNIIANENIRVADHAIPSPIAYIKDFRKKMANGDKDALNEWKGMIALIALHKLEGKNITIKEIPLYPDAVTGQPTTFGSIICDALHENSQITGYEYDANGVPVHKTLAVFCKDGVPFAMFMPGMVICPFKEYPENLFADIKWYDVNEKKWTSVRDVIQKQEPALTMQSQKLYAWLSAVLNTHPNMYLQNFQSEILGGCQPPVINDDIKPIAEETGAFSVAWDELRQYAPQPKGTPKHQFADKIFVVIPPENHVSGDNGARRGLRIGSDPYHFTPCELLENNKSYYVIPPVHKDVINSIREGYSQLVKWNVFAKEDEEGKKSFVFEFSLYYTQEGSTNAFVHTYSEKDIAWTESLPYLSMWPFVNFSTDSWNEHYISIFADDSAQGRRLTDYKAFTENPSCKHIVGERAQGQTIPTIKIDVIAKNTNAAIEAYDCFSNYGEKKFKMIQSTSEPFAIEFSYEDAGKSYYLGNWIIDRERPVASVDNTTANKTFFIAMDFGTTSTNVYLREVIPGDEFANLKSIASAGKFLLDIYNPYVTEQNKGQKNKSDFIQNYYLFSGRCGEMGKIFTYGQNFHVTKNGVQVGGIISNVTGRAVVVDEDYIIENKQTDSGIYNGLKMKDNGVSPQLKEATDNFICNILTYAVLEAKAEGASTVEVRVSYPAEDFASVVLDNLDEILRKISGNSGITITRNGATEARSAGEYFAKKIAGRPEAPVPEEGYAIIDIGGGTSDFSFWKKEMRDPAVDMKAEHSFGYAGNYLVTKTIIQVLRDKDVFRNMWLCNDSDYIARAIANYNNIEISRPIGNVRLPDFRKKASTLDFILEKCKINDGVLSQNHYQDLIATVRMKYYALFYLIAYYIRTNMTVNEGKISLSEDNFRLCFAGCGSKGMNICRQGRFGAQFDRNVEKLFSNILYGTENAMALRTLPPQCDNKEEVVVGLTLIEKMTGGKKKAAFVAETPGGWGAPSGWGKTPEVVEAEDAAAEEEFVPPSKEEVKKVFMDLLDMIAYFEDAGNYAGEHVLAKVDPRMNEDAALHFNTMFSSIKSSVLSANPDPETYSQYFSLLMLESMIDTFIGG